MTLSAHLWSLVKPRIVGLLCLTGASALVAAGGATPVQTIGFVVAGALVAGGSAAANCWYDRDLDPKMERTANRPLARGALSSRGALAFTLALLAAGTVIGIATLSLVSVAYMWLGVTSYVGLYTVLLKRRSRLGVILGGSAGAFPVLAGWTVVKPLSTGPLLVAGLVFAWTPAHAWALAYVYRDDFAAVDVPTVPVVESANRSADLMWYAAVGAVAVATAVVPFAGQTYAVVAAVSSLCFLYAYRRFRRTVTEETAVLAFFTSNCYLAILFLAWASSGTDVGGLWTAILAGVLTLSLFAWLWRRQPALRGVPAAPVDLEDTFHDFFGVRSGVRRIVSAAAGVRAELTRRAENLR